MGITLVTSQYAVCFNLVCVHSARIPARLPACLLRASQEVVVLAVAPVFFLQMSLKATMAAEAAQHSARVTPTKVKVGASCYENAGARLAHDVEFATPFFTSPHNQ